MMWCKKTPLDKSWKESGKNLERMIKEPKPMNPRNLSRLIRNEEMKVVQKEIGECTDGLERKQKDQHG
jgi:hypothetical protein